MQISRKFLTAAIALSSTAVLAAEPTAEAAEAVARCTAPSETIALAIGAAITMALSVLGAGAAVGKIGSAALGAAAEKPELLSKSILFVAIAEGLAVLGFVIAIMLASKINFA